MNVMNIVAHRRQMVGQGVRTVYRLYTRAEFEWSLNGDQSCCKVVVLGTQGLRLGFNLCVAPLPVKLGVLEFQSWVRDYVSKSEIRPETRQSEGVNRIMSRTLT